MKITIGFSAALAMTLGQIAMASSKESKFETLAGEFSSAKAPRIDEMKYRAWSGRCFSPDEPDSPKNAAYVIRIGTETSSGPLFPLEETHYVGSSVQDLKMPGDYWDSMTHLAVYSFATDAGADTEAKQNSTGIVMTDYRGVMSEMRKSSEYFVERISYGSVVEQYCYYYIELPLSR